jgi:hypothetical protein
MRQISNHHLQGGSHPDRTLADAKWLRSAYQREDFPRAMP